MQAHCGHARYVWNLAVEQLGYRHHRQPVPNAAERSRQLTEARQEFEWLAAGPRVVQEQALRDFDKALRCWWSGAHKSPPNWRKRGFAEGFGVQDGHAGAEVKNLNSKWSAVRVPRVGWVKFRRTRDVAPARSFRVTLDPTGRWHVAFFTTPTPIEAPGNFEIVGVDRGVVVTLAYSDGRMLNAPKPRSLRHAAKAVARCKRGSNRRRKAKGRLARVQAVNRDRRKDFVEKATTDLARRYDLIRVEALNVTAMARSRKGTIEAPGRMVRQKAGLNRSIMAGGWGLFAERLQDKAPGRVEKVNPAYTSLTCSRCRHVDRNSRKSQALFRCTACNYTANADLNAACNIAAGRAVRGETGLPVSLKRVPQHVASPAA